MDIESLRAHCLAKPGVEECFPFGEETMVFKVAGKMFVLAGLDSVPLSINYKADPDDILDHREKYEAVSPGYHQNKTYWNTVTLDGSIGDAVLKKWIDASYDVVVSKLNKQQRLLLSRS